MEATAQASNDVRTPNIFRPVFAYGGSVPLASLNSVLYKGYLYDPIMGTYWLGRRHYDPMSGRFLEPDGPGYLSPSSAGGLNPYLYCYNDPIAYADANGSSPEWWDWVQGIGRILAGVGAIVSGALVLASGVAGIGVAIAAGITIGAGALTLNNGISDTIGYATGYNYMADGLFQGDDVAYAWFSGTAEGIATIGSFFCGGWLAYNAPRITAYKHISGYHYSGTTSDAIHMARPWQKSVLAQKAVIRYGKMARDGMGWAFSAPGYFNSKSVSWRLILNLSTRTIWHWGMF